MRQQYIPELAISSKLFQPWSIIGRTLTVILLSFISIVTSAQTIISFNAESQPLLFGVIQIEKVLKRSGQEVKRINNPIPVAEATLTIQVLSDPQPELQKEGFKISRHGNSLSITSNDPVGAMYGAMDVADQLEMGKTWKTISDKLVNPHFTVRAVKFNLPWSPYRTGQAMDQHAAVCRDLSFWQAFLDQMAINRFNVLSLWNVHPFSFMVKPTNFPDANNFSDLEMKEWKIFWTSLLRMAKYRGIETFIVNWNIAVSPEFAAAYKVQERNDTSALVKRYTREVVTQVINEYPDLSGIGITLADWMSNFRSPGSPLPEMTAKDREDWIEETVVAGIKDANRRVKFLHRSVLSSDPTEMRRVITNAQLLDTTLVEIKFNWSHGHSTPLLALTHDAHSGKVDNGYWSPLPENYRVQWMIRNEDFFILRWGQPDFIRKHIAQNTELYVNGYFVGSEGYIPAKDFSHLPNNHRTWNYAFEKQWLFYQVWGRLLYDPTTPDSVFEASFDQRYGKGKGSSLMKAFAAASNMPLKLASFHGATWDYTLYSEGFLAPFASNGGLHEKVSSFISIDEFINHRTLDPQYLSIPDYVESINKKKTPEPGKISPLQLANSLEENSQTVVNMVKQLRPKATGAFACELDDLETWAYLCRYLSDKLRAGVALHTFRMNNDKASQQKAVTLLAGCLNHWKKIAEITSSHYQEVPYLDDQSTKSQPDNDGRMFSWLKYVPQVERDILLAKEAKGN